MDVQIPPIDSFSDLESLGDDISLGSSLSFLDNAGFSEETGYGDSSAPVVVSAIPSALHRSSILSIDSQGVPRVVTREDVSAASNDGSSSGDKKRRASNSPLDELRERVRAKRASASSTSSTESAAKKIKGEEGENSTTEWSDSIPQLHRVCCGSNIAFEDVAAAVKRDPLAASRSFTVTRTVKARPGISRSAQRASAREPCTYPCNLAIKYGASREVVRLLMETAPSVLMLRDGTHRETTLHILLKHFRLEYHELVDMVLLKAPRTAAVQDVHENTPLHAACENDVSLETIRHLTILYPAAINIQNFQGKTPFEMIASTVTREPVRDVFRRELALLRGAV